MKKSMALALLTIGLCSLLMSCTTMADARIEEAKYESQTKIAEAQQATERQRLMLLPLSLLIVAGAGAAYMVLYYRGKAHLIQVQAATMLPAPPSFQQLPPPKVQRAALAYDAVAVPDTDTPGAWLLLLTDGQRLRMLPPPKR